MVSDYIEEQVFHAMSERVGKLVGGHSLALIDAVNLLPLGPLACGCLAYQSMAFYNGTLEGHDPLTVSSLLFSRLYLTMLQNTYPSDGSGGSGDGRQLLAVSERHNQAIASTSDPSPENGGVCAAMTAASSAPVSFVPAYEATWTPDPDTGPLVIDIDAWRPGPTEKWQQGKPPAGTEGEHLQARLRYSDIRICTVTPKALSGREGWYDAELVEGMKTGRLGSVLFCRLGGFPDTAAFRRASAFVVVGSVRFSLNSGFSFDFPKSLKAVDRLLSGHQTPAPPIRISSHLSVPSPTPVMPSARQLNSASAFNTTQSHWDSGDLYARYNAGFVIGVTVDAPFTV